VLICVYRKRVVYLICVQVARRRRDMKRNAFFQLIQKDDGMYLKAYPEVDGGEKLSVEDVLNYLDKKNLKDVDSGIVKYFVEDANSGKKDVLVKVLEGKQIPEKEFGLVSIDKKGYLAKIRLYPPSDKGARLSTSELKNLIEQNGVKYGIIEKNIEIALKARLYCMDILVAKAKLPVNGSDAEIVYSFNAEKTLKPTMSEDGSVDFHKLDMIESVKEGQLLATLIPIDYGEPGKDVYGNMIRPKKVRNKRLRHGKNIHLSDDKLQMYSDVSGNVTLVNDMVFVTDTYTIEGDVGPSTGDIDYDGAVEVKGNVITGYTVKATGDITVNGAVEGAMLISEGKIVLKRGMQGMGKGVMEANGDVISNFIESATVKSGGAIYTDAIMHSNISANGDVIVNGKRGLIAGGSVKTTTKIETKVAGSTMGTQTELEVGFDTTLGERYRNIEKHIDQMTDEKDSIVKNLKILQKRMQTKGKLEPEKMKLIKEGTERIKVIDQTIEEETEAYERIDEEMQRTSDGGKVRVENIAYPGVKIVISNISTFVHTETHRCTFIREGADIRVKSY
jgi:uncharacterized protein (DUF342 family)